MSGEGWLFDGQKCQGDLRWPYSVHERFNVESSLVELGRGFDVVDHEARLQDVGDWWWDRDRRRRRNCGRVSHVDGLIRDRSLLRDEARCCREERCGSQDCLRECRAARSSMPPLRESLMCLI